MRTPNFNTKKSFLRIDFFIGERQNIVFIAFPAWRALITAAVVGAYQTALQERLLGGTDLPPVAP